MGSRDREPGGRRALPSGARDDRGFTLVESVVAVVLIAVLLAAAAVGMIGATRSEATLRGQQVAVRLALRALDLARAASITADAQGCVPLLDGRTDAAVLAQWQAAPDRLDLSGTDPVTTGSTCTGDAIVPLAGLPATGGTSVSDPVVVGGVEYAVATFVGSCRLPLAGGDCGAAADVPAATSTQVYRVVVAVSWTSVRNCSGGCFYTTSTLIDPSDDPVFDVRNPTPGMPTAIDATAGDGTATVSWGAPASEGDSPVLGYRITATPTGGGDSVSASVGPTGTSVTLSGLVDGLTYTVTVVAWNALGDGAAATTSVVPYPQSVMSSARTALWLDGADGGSLFSDDGGTTAVVAAGESVRRWADRSASGNDATVRSGQSPPAAALTGGRLVPAFDGSSTCLTVDPALLPTGTVTATLFTVATLSDAAPATSPQEAVVTWGNDSAGAGRRLVKSAGDAEWTADRVTSLAVTDAVDFQDAGAHVAAAEFTGTTTSLWSAGRSGATSATGLATTGSGDASVGCAISGSGGSALHWNGLLHEVVVLTGSATDGERRSIEEYLGRKWDAAVTPDPPPSVVVTSGGSGTLAVVWDQPLWDGGSPVSGFTATATPGGVTCTSTGSGCVLAGLTAGTPYSVTVTSSNVVGAGPASAAVSGTP